MDGVLAWLDLAIERIDRWSERLSYELFRVGLYVTMPGLVVLVTLDVALRYLFNAPLQWGRDVNGLLLLMTIFCALPHAWDRAYHIRMEVFYLRLSSARRRGVDVLAALAGIAVFGLMAYGTYDLTNMATLAGWSWTVVFVDMAWGAFATGLTGLVASFATLKLTSSPA